MLRFLETIRSMPVPGESGLTPDDLARAVLDAEDSLLSARFHLQADGLDEPARRTLLAYADWLEAVAVTGGIANLEAARAAYVAGSIHELLFQSGGEEHNHDALLGLALLLRSSSQPHLGTVLAERSLAYRSGSALQRFGSVIRCFAAADHFGVIREHQAAMARFGRVDPYSLSEGELARMGVFERLAGATAALSWQLITDRADVGHSAVESVETWIRDSTRYLSPSLHSLANRWLLAMRASRSRSVARVLNEAHLDEHFIALLLSDGFIEFWPQQLKAIESGMFRSAASVVSLPTGSGKTLLAELVLAKRVLDSPEGWGCYVVPTRALVHQVARTLAVRLQPAGIRVRTVLAGTEDTGVLEDELEELTEPHTVTVATPERLDAYYRVDASRFTGMRILVVDEAQQLGDEERGVLLEQLIAKVRVRQPYCKVLLLTAGGTNVDELAEWLGGASHYAAPDRVNRQQLAVAVKFGAVRELRTWTHNGERRRAAEFDGGLVTAAALRQHESDQRGIFVSVANCFAGRAQQRLLNDTWYDMDGGTNSPEHATQLALRLHRAGQSTLVFCSTQASARAQALSLANELPVDQGPITQELVQAIARHVGADHPLTTCVAHGVAFHHSSLPTTVQRLVESAFAQSVVRTLCSTSTLREGINLPAGNVIIAGEQRPDASTGKQRPMPVVDFVNLVGRAGRPQFDREGLAVIVPNKLSNARQVGNEYLLYGPDALAVRSAMDTLLDFLTGSPDTLLQSLETHLQSLVLSLYASGFRDAEEIGDLLTSTLANVQLDIDTVSLSSNLAAAFRATEAELGEARFTAVAKTGLGFIGGTTMFQFAENNLDLLAGGNPRVDYDPSMREVMADCVLACRDVPDIKYRTLNDESLWDEAILVPIIDAWLTGKSYLEIAELAPFAERAHGLESAVQTIADLSQWLPWSLGALNVALASFDRTPDPFVAMLPMYVRFGVPSRTAAYLSLLGIFDRNAAMEFSHERDLDGADLGAVADWIQRGIPQSPRVDALTHSVLQRGAARARVHRARLLALDAEACTVGDIVQFRIEGDSVVARSLADEAEVASAAAASFPLGSTLRQLGAVPGVVVTVDGDHVEVAVIT